jgi:hypothetical protein
MKQHNTKKQTAQKAVNVLLGFIAAESVQATAAPAGVPYWNLFYGGRVEAITRNVPLQSMHEVVSSRERTFVPGMLVASHTEPNGEVSISGTEFSFRMVIESFLGLPQDWDSFGSGPVPEVAVNNAKKALQILERSGLFPSRVSPTRDSSVLFEFESEQSRALLEFFGDGAMSAVFRTPEGDELFDPSTIEELVHLTCERESVLV